MSHDPLERAARALKEQTETSPEDVRRLRARVLATVGTEERRRSKRWVYALPLAAALAATTAFAARGGGLKAAVHAVEQLVGIDEGATEHAAAAPARSVAAAPPPPAAEAEPAASAEPAPSVEVADAPPAKAAVTEELRVVVAPPPRASAPVASAPTVDPSAAEMTAYRRAHELHFVAQDCARAVPAWDAYLATAPSGSLVVEARYNRGICLAKLGRVTEARTALRPFAEGTVAGGYRQRESRALLDALAADAALE